MNLSNQSDPLPLGKVPALTLTFWIIKILATTLGETAGDALSMSMSLGYLVSTLIFTLFFLLAVIAQINAKKFHPFLYWTTILATTTVGTTLADFSTRSLGFGYAGGSVLLFTLLLLSLALWHKILGNISIESIFSVKAEMFYWLTIMFSQTLGTALGDWTADTAGIGYLGASIIFGGVLLMIIAAYFFTHLSRTWLFWSAFIITRPLGAVLGDFLDKPITHGGLELSRHAASCLLFFAIVACLFIFPQHAAKTNH